MAFGIPTGARAGVGVATVGEYDQVHALQRGGILDSNQLAQNGELKIYHKPLFGLAAQACYAPLWALVGNGLTFEFLLVGNGAEAVDDTAPHTSTNWTISNVSLAMDILTVDGLFQPPTESEKFSCPLSDLHHPVVSGNNFNRRRFANSAQFHTL
jgi:hypothetical protein